MGAAVYFAASCAVLLLCLLSFLRCERLPFTIACVEGGKLQEIATPTSAVAPTLDDAVRVTPTRNTDSLRSTNASDNLLPLPNLVGASDAPGSPYTSIAAVPSRPPLLGLLWKWCLAVTLIYTVTIALFPSLTSDIQSAGGPCVWSHGGSGLFGPFLFVMFNLGDLIGRLLRCTISNPNLILALVALRVVFVPLFVLCKSGSSPDALLSASDAFPTMIMLVFAISNGWLTTSIFVHSAATVEPEARQRAGTFTVCFLNTGLALGSAFSFFTRWLSCQCNPFLNPVINSTAPS